MSHDKNVTNYGNMGIKGTGSIRQIDLGPSKSKNKNKICQKMQKTEITVFPFVFSVKLLCKKEAL